MDSSEESSVFIGNDWDEAFLSLIPFIDLQKLMKTVTEQYRRYPSQINPPYKDVFRAFKETPLKDIKVVLLGQDPYPGHGAADGLAFSAKNQTRPPSSLMNIFKEINLEFGSEGPPILDLTFWARQGVFLYNTSLLSKDETPLFFGNVKIFNDFSQAIIRKIDSSLSGVIFIFLGNKAKVYSKFVNPRRNPLLIAPHPSPLSAKKGFFKSGIFKKCNDLLREEGKSPIDWLGQDMK